MIPKGWHRADIVAAVHKRGSNLAALARSNGLCDSALRAALGYPRTPSNTIIAEFLGESLHNLWPKWFDPDGKLTAPARPKPTSRGKISRRSARSKPSRPARKASSQKQQQQLTIRGGN